MILEMLVVALSLQVPPGPVPSAPTGSGEAPLALGEAAPAGSPEQRRWFEDAVRDYRGAEAAANTAAMKAAALEMLVRLYDARHLNEPAQAELVLRELAAVVPNDLTVLFRLARVQEDQQDLDAAEATLLYARHAQPADIEPNRMLTQFYARRTAETLSATPQAGAPPAPAPSPVGPPDKDGFYHVNGEVGGPRRLDIPAYPKMAQDSGLEGTILIEVSLDDAGVMTGSRVLRSIPVLDDAALDAVRNWHYEPTMAEGRAVPAKLLVTVSFSLRK